MIEFFYLPGVPLLLISSESVPCCRLPQVCVVVHFLRSRQPACVSALGVRRAASDPGFLDPIFSDSKRQTPEAVLNQIAHG